MLAECGKTGHVTTTAGFATRQAAQDGGRRRGLRCALVCGRLSALVHHAAAKGKGSAMDRRTLHHAGHAVSQIKPNRVEEPSVDENYAAKRQAARCFRWE